MKEYKEYLWDWMTRPTLLSIHLLISVVCALSMKTYVGLPLILVWIFGMPWAIMTDDKNRGSARRVKT